jgi:tRNA C32,U32 (ribose-2'-O)-methylase TrmJ
MISVILARPENPENIGLAARAMKNTGFRDLRLAGIRRIRVKAFASAVHAVDILEGARLFPDLPSAAADLQVVFAATARPRSNFPALTLEAAIGKIRAYPASTRIGLLFGNERTGLTTEEMRSSTFRFSIPQAGRQPSYNLGMAVLLTLFPLFAGGAGASATSATTWPPLGAESTGPPVSPAAAGEPPGAPDARGAGATGPRGPRNAGGTGAAAPPLPRAEQDAVIERILAILGERGFLHDTNRRHVTDVVFELFGRLSLTAKDRSLLLAVFHKGAGAGPASSRKEK